MQQLSTVRLLNAVFFAHHGVMQEEQRTGGRYEVDVAMDLQFEEAARRDDLSRTVDYERVYHMVQDLVISNRFYLIERLAYLIGQRILGEFKMIQRIAVTVRKPNPPIGGTSDAVEAVYRATRQQSPDSDSSA